MSCQVYGQRNSTFRSPMPRGSRLLMAFENALTINIENADSWRLPTLIIEWLGVSPNEDGSSGPASWKVRLEFGIIITREIDSPRDDLKPLEGTARRATGEPERSARRVRMKLCGTLHIRR